MDLTLSSIAIALWLSSAAILTSYVFSMSLSTLHLSAGFFVGLVFGSLIRFLIPSTHRLFAAGALLFATIPFARTLAIQLGSTGLFLTAWVLGLSGGLFLYRSRCSPAIMTALIATVTFGADWFQRHNTPVSLYGVVFGASAMASALVVDWCQTRKPLQFVTGMVCVATSALCFTLPVSHNFIRDSARSRMSLMSVPRDTRTESHVLLINGTPHFNSAEEQSSHACTTQIPIALFSKIKRVPRTALVLFGGDGLIARNLLALKSIQSVTVIEPDGTLINMARDNAILRSYNLDSFRNERTRVVHASPYQWLSTHRSQFDLIVADLPAPKTSSHLIYYTNEFQTLLSQQGHEHSVTALSIPSTVPTALLSSLSAAHPGASCAYFENREGNRGFFIKTQLVPTSAIASAIPTYLSQTCRRSERLLNSNQLFIMEDIVTGSKQGRGRATQLDVQRISRLSLPR